MFEIRDIPGLFYDIAIIPTFDVREYRSKIN